MKSALNPVPFPVGSTHTRGSPMAPIVPPASVPLNASGPPPPVVGLRPKAKFTTFFCPFAHTATNVEIEEKVVPRRVRAGHVWLLVHFLARWLAQHSRCRHGRDIVKA